jgi:multidrug efflux pump subunit AcrB
MLAGTLVTIAGFVPVGFAASSGEYVFALCGCRHRAIVSPFVAVIFAPLLCRCPAAQHRAVG